MHRCVCDQRYACQKRPRNRPITEQKRPTDTGISGMRGHAACAMARNLCALCVWVGGGFLLNFFLCFVCVGGRRVVGVLAYLYAYVSVCVRVSSSGERTRTHMRTHTRTHAHTRDIRTCIQVCEHRVYTSMCLCVYTLTHPHIVHLCVCV